jgi:hypothetical protein
MTPARQYVERQQRRYPPCYPFRDGVDRAKQLCNILVPSLPTSIQGLIRDGTVAVAEVGKYQPDVRVITIPKGGVTSRNHMPTAHQKNLLAKQTRGQQVVPVAAAPTV